MAVRIEGDGMDRFLDAVDQLGSRNAKRAYARAINHTGAKGNTQVKRKLAKQVGLTQRRLVTLGVMKKHRASAGSLKFEINSRGSELPLREFSAKQFSYGVRAKPWGNSQRFDGTFIFAGTPTSGKFVAGGHVFRRTSADSKPIAMLFGPSIPKEMVRGESAEAFDRTSGDLPGRVAHEVARLTKGAVT